MIFSILYQMKNLPIKGWSRIIFLDHNEGLGGASLPIAGSVGRSEALQVLSKSITCRKIGKNSSIERVLNLILLIFVRKIHNNPTINDKNKNAQSSYQNIIAEVKKLLRFKSVLDLSLLIQC